MCQRKHIHWTCGHYSIRHQPCPNPQPRARSCFSFLLGPRPCPVEDVLRIRDLPCRECQERAEASRRRKAEKHTRRVEMAGQYRKFKAASKEEAAADYGTLSGYQGVQGEEMVLQGGLAPPGAARVRGVRGAERGVVPPPRLADRKFLEQRPKGPTKASAKAPTKAPTRGPAKGPAKASATGPFSPGSPWEPVKPRGKAPSRAESIDVPLVLREEYVDVPLV